MVSVIFILKIIHIYSLDINIQSGFSKNVEQRQRKLKEAATEYKIKRSEKPFAPLIFKVVLGLSGGLAPIPHAL